MYGLSAGIKRSGCLESWPLVEVRLASVRLKVFDCSSLKKVT